MASSLNVNVTVDMLKRFSLTVHLVRGVSIGIQRWSCDGHIPNVTLHLDKLMKTDDFKVKPRGKNMILYTRLWMGNTFWKLLIEIRYIDVIIAKYLVKLGIPTNRKSRTVINRANRHMVTHTVRSSDRCVLNTHNPMASQPSLAPKCNCHCKCSVSKCLYYVRCCVMHFSNRWNTLITCIDYIFNHNAVDIFAGWMWIFSSMLYVAWTTKHTWTPNHAICLWYTW